MSFPANPLFNRTRLLQQLHKQAVWDLVVIGGGATGLGIAVDAASRGYHTALFEQADFAKGTSSRSTKLVHGGVRYLAQGNIPLVYSALKERGILLQNAPHIVRKQAFIIPCYSWSEKLKYVVGLKLYDALSGRWSFGKSRLLSRQDVLDALPGLNEKGLQGGVLYFDGQFDDARLALNLAQTAIEQKAVVLNYMKVMALLKSGKTIGGVQVRDEETGTEYTVHAKAVINATGVFADSIQQMDMPESRPLLRQSQGVHIVIDRSFFPSEEALMIPKTHDGRVLFAIPWHNELVVGTTDTPMNTQALEPVALESEVRFILETLNPFLKKQVTEKNIQSVFAGLRPLVLPQKEVVSTKELARDHKILVNESGLITIIGGKWTTYRKMAEETINAAVKTANLPRKTCRTKELCIHGYMAEKSTSPLDIYGSDGMAILKSWDINPNLKKQVHPRFPYTEAEVHWAVHNEMARTVEDVLARRLRLLFLDAEAAIQAAPQVAAILRDALEKEENWASNQVAQFVQLAQQYLPKKAIAPIETST